MYKNENLKLIQDELKKDNIEAYLIFTSDPHFSEYIASFYLDERKFFCPFSGSAGEVLITQNGAYLFTDGRYWLQAEKELDSTPIKLVKKGDKGVLPLDKFIKSLNIKSLAIDFSMLNKFDYQKFIDNKIELIDKSYKYLVKDLKELPKDKVFSLKEELNTYSYKEKIEKILSSLKEEEVEATLISPLDDIAYILNLRGNDIPCNPVFYSYLYLSKNYGNHLFIDLDKIDFKLEGIEFHKYKEVFSFLKEHNKIKTLLDPFKSSMKIISCLDNIKFNQNPSYVLKAVKLEKEVSNLKRIQALDGVALVKFQKYLEENLSKNLTELDYSNKLEEYRLSNKECFELSFNTIAAVGKNAAEMHYAPSKENTSVVSNKEIEFLVDSGGQYMGGTTDTTRTFIVGKPTQEFIKDYTLTLKAVINLSSTIFLKGSTGQTIDIRARELMWENGMDYKCGTGHGVGYILNVHEGPNGFRYKKVPERDDGGEILPGMVTTIEPGVYKADKYGIRIENNLLCVKAFETSDGEFYKFETITYVPIPLEAVDKKMLNKKEKEWINSYHKLVYSKLFKLIDDPNLLKFLKSKTKAIK